MSNKKTADAKKETKPPLKIRDLQPRKDAKGGKPAKPKPITGGDPCDGSE